jgi:hypothetical protein
MPHRSQRLRLAMVVCVFVLSLLPLCLTVITAQPAWMKALQPALAATPGAAPYPELVEMRPLAPAPDTWQGKWFEIDKNYARAERWFSDHMAMRNLIIRSKNELDYQLFRSSSRVYYGHDGELFSRSQTDIELPTTEVILSSRQKLDAVVEGVLRYDAALRQRGITMVLMAPVSKQYFKGSKLPFFAPRLPSPSGFMTLHQRLLQAPNLQMIDVTAILKANQAAFPIYYRQDFHWTDPLALQVAAATTERIAHLEGSPLTWRHRLEIEYTPHLGSEARFAARLNRDDVVIEPQLKKTWQDGHTIGHAAAGSGLEFETGRLEGRGLLPPTCMYGNSFSDGMLRAGLIEHFEQFTKFDRSLTLPDLLPRLGTRCKYLIVQVLDLQADRWLHLTQFKPAAPAAGLVSRTEQ